MWLRIFRRASLLHSHTTHVLFIPKTTFHPPPPSPPPPFRRHISAPFSFSSSTITTTTHNSDADDDNSDLDDPSNHNAHQLHDEMLHDIETITSALKDFSVDAPHAKRRLEHCDVSPSPDLVTHVLSRLRNDWSAAFTFFLWAGTRPGYSHSARAYHCMIAILAKMRRFDTAWSLVDEMNRGGAVTPPTILILIRRYAAVHDVAKAINAFYALKRFGFVPGVEEFHGLLSALCRYKNVEDAEHLLLCNEKTFAFETKSFNIVLNGWCNVLVHLREAKRFWKDIERRGIGKDVVTYGCMISCFSKAGNLKDVLKLFHRMREDGIVPDRKVYNAVIYALAKGKCIDEAKNLFKAMEDKGVAPNAVTFNSLIRPLCKARQVDDARLLFDEMWQRGLTPSIRTFHSFFDVLRSAEEMFELLDRMKQTGCSPVIDTYLMLIRKLCRWRQHESVFKLWDEICENGLCPDRSAYIVLIHGLFLNGKLEEAYKYYNEMMEKGFAPEPKTEEMIQAWLSGKQSCGQLGTVDLGGKKADKDPLNKKQKGTSRPHFPKQPEMRSITRERGFSLW